MVKSSVNGRTRQRGAVYIEALIVSVLFTVGLGGSVSLYRLYSAKLDTEYASRQAAWVRAMDGCGNGHPIDLKTALRRVVDAGRHLAEGASDGGLDLGASGEDLHAGLEALMPHFELVTVATATAERPRQVSTTTMMACNEVPHDLGTRRNALSWLAELFF